MLSKKQRHHFADKGPYSQSYGFSSSHVQMWELDNKESWAPKNWCSWTVVLEKTLESPLDCKEIKPVHPKGNQPWIFIGRTDVEAEVPIIWPPDVKSWLIGNDLGSGKVWGQKRGWQRMRWLDGITDSMDMSLRKLGDSEGQGSLRALVHGVMKSQTRPSKWITTKNEKEEAKPLLYADDKDTREILKPSKNYQNSLMNLVKLQNTKLMQKNLWHSCALAKKDQKLKLRKQFHLSLQQEE